MTIPYRPNQATIDLSALGRPLMHGDILLIEDHHSNTRIYMKVLVVVKEESQVQENTETT